MNKTFFCDTCPQTYTESFDTTSSKIVCFVQCTSIHTLVSDRSDFPYFYANEIIILLFFVTMQYEVIVTTFWGLKNVSKKKKRIKAFI